MTATAIQIRKEARELLPWSAGLGVAIVACGSLSEHMAGTGMRQFLLVVGVSVYSLGSIVLGAWSIGHEYTHRTLSGLLAQPVSRAWVLRTKFAVLGTVLAALATLAAVILDADPFHFSAAIQAGPRIPVALSITMPALVGLSLAPWLTMVTRGPLPGAVLATAVSTVLWSGSSPFIARASTVWIGAVVVVGAGAMMTWRTFVRLQAVDAPRAAIAAPFWRQRADRESASPAPRDRRWLLVLKELRLQQLTMFVSVLAAAAWLALIVARSLAPNYLGPSLGVVWVMHGGLVAVLAGALASAEERQLGTAEWQAVQPMAGWSQWTLKVVVAVVLAHVLAFGVPAVLAALHPSPDDISIGSGMVGAVLALFAGALYVSTLSGSGTRALLATIPVLAVGSLVATLLFATVGRGSSLLFQRVAWAIDPTQYVGRATLSRLVDGLGEPLGLGLVVVLAVLGYQNHRRAERSVHLVARQAIWIVAYLVFGALVFGFAVALIWAATMRTLAGQS